MESVSIGSPRQEARLESLPCAADFSAAHFKFQPRFQPRNFRKKQKEMIELLFSDTNTAVQAIRTKERSPAHSANFPIWARRKSSDKFSGPLRRGEGGVKPLTDQFR